MVLVDISQCCLVVGLNKLKISAQGITRVRKNTIWKVEVSTLGHSTVKRNTQIFGCRSADEVVQTSIFGVLVSDPSKDSNLVNYRHDFQGLSFLRLNL